MPLTQSADKCAVSIEPSTYWSESIALAAVTLPSKLATSVATAYPVPDVSTVVVGAA